MTTPRPPSHIFDARRTTPDATHDRKCAQMLGSEAMRENPGGSSPQWQGEIHSMRLELLAPPYCASCPGALSPNVEQPPRARALNAASVRRAGVVSLASVYRRTGEEHRNSTGTNAGRAE
jgi:hypothetical protein